MNLPNNVTLLLHAPAIYKDLRPIWIVIPSYAEPELIRTLDSIHLCTDSDVKEKVHILIVINHKIGDTVEFKEINQKSWDDVLCWRDSISGYNCEVIWVAMDDSKAGVGLARKTGMDYAAENLVSGGMEKGLIVCLDADCRVSANYVEALWNWYCQSPYQACSIRFEHPLDEHSEHSLAIAHYELHLRYYIRMKFNLRLPYAFHTIGSAMAVRAKTYIEVGGMNTRQAGEDFYFLHKIIQSKSVEQYNLPCIYPSDRLSERVPFGTGRAVMEYLEKGRYSATYHPQTFEILVPWLDCVRSLCFAPENRDFRSLDSENFHPTFLTFLGDLFFERKWQEIVGNSKPGYSRLKRFYQFFDAFKLMKWCHYFRDQSGLEFPTIDAARYAYGVGDIPSISKNGNAYQITKAILDTLKYCREIDRACAYDNRLYI